MDEIRLSGLCLLHIPTQGIECKWINTVSRRPLCQ